MTELIRLYVEYVSKAITESFHAEKLATEI